MSLFHDAMVTSLNCIFKSRYSWVRSWWYPHNAHWMEHTLLKWIVFSFSSNWILSSKNIQWRSKRMNLMKLHPFKSITVVKFPDANELKKPRRNSFFFSLFSPQSLEYRTVSFFCCTERWKGYKRWPLYSIA